MTKELQEEKEEKISNVIEEFTTEWIEKKMEIKKNFDMLFKKLD